MKKPQSDGENDALSLSSAEEIIEPISKFVFSTLPWTGGISELIGSHFSKKRRQRLESFLNTLLEDFSKLQKRINKAILDSDEFSDRLEQVLQAVTTTPHLKKHELFRGILLNAAIRGVKSNFDVDYYLYLIDNLSELHLRILQFLQFPENHLKQLEKDTKMLTGGFASMFRYAFPDTSNDSLRSAFGDLYRLKLLNTDDAIFATMTSASGLNLLGNRVTELGKSFLEYCLVPES